MIKDNNHWWSWLLLVRKEEQLGLRLKTASMFGSDQTPYAINYTRASELLSVIG